MKTIITQQSSKLIKKLQCLALLALISCFGAGQETSNIQIELLTPQGGVLQTQLALTVESQSQGLSGVQDNDFAADQAMLFYYLEDGIREFWMPDTYFNLDIFFLDADLRVIDIERNVQAHPGMKEPPAIPRTRPIRARHVLELKSASVHARQLKIGDQIRWPGSPTQTEIKARIRREQ
jgi:uncharacterized protein